MFLLLFGIFCLFFGHIPPSISYRHLMAYNYMFFSSGLKLFLVTLCWLCRHTYMPATHLIFLLQLKWVLCGSYSNSFTNQWLGPYISYFIIQSVKACILLSLLCIRYVWIFFCFCYILIIFDMRWLWIACVLVCFG